jgi:hypothetical protein
MSIHDGVADSFDSSTELAARVGFRVSLFTAALTIVCFTIAILTPPRSGPFCTDSCVLYPYGDTVPFFPRDYLWIFPAILLTPLFLILCACAHSWVSPPKRLYSRIALLFAAIAASLVTLDYFLQIEVLQPSLLRGEADGIALISQYNPHGLFIAMEDLGYLMMSVAMLFLGMSFSRTCRLENFVRWLLIGSAVLGFATFLGMSLYFGSHMETRFELAIITISWTALTITSIVLSVLFRRTLRQAERQSL